MPIARNDPPELMAFKPDCTINDEFDKHEKILLLYFFIVLNKQAGLEMAQC